MASVTITQAREAIYQRFVDQWGSTSAFSFDNEAVKPTAGSPFLLLYVRHRFSNLECVGGMGDGGYNTFRRVGTVNMRISVPLDAGARTADTLAHQARAIFEGVTLASNAIRFSSVDIRELGSADGWFVVMVEAPFQYDERK